MSNLVCQNCKSIAVEYEDYVGGTSYYRCKTCGMRGNKDKFTQVTTFDRITASPEVLAMELVTLDCDGWWAYVGFGKRESYLTREEAIAATVEKLKEVEKLSDCKSCHGTGYLKSRCDEPDRVCPICNGTGKDEK